MDFNLEEINFKKLTKGVLLSLLFIFLFGVFILGECGLSSLDIPKAVFSASISENFGNQKNGQSKKIAEKVLPELNLAESTKSAISVDSDLSGNDKVIFQKNNTSKLPIASLTKLMTAVVSMENYDLLKVISVSKNADLQLPMQADLKLGDRMPAESFLYIMLIESSNKAAYALSERMGTEKFVDLMNQKAKSLRMVNTFYADPTGVSPQNVSTANDLVKLTEYILKYHPSIADISKTKEFNVPGYGKITNTDELLSIVPEVVCSKTGFTSAAKGCLLLVLDNPSSNSYLINVVLGADDRFAEMKKIIEWQSATCLPNN